MEGNAFALARWFQAEKYANKPEDDFVREDVLNEVYQADAVGKAADGTILVRTPTGACMIEQDEERALVIFDFVSNEMWTRTRFWMNRSSVEELLAQIDALPVVDFDALFVGAKVGDVPVENIDAALRFRAERPRREET